VPAANNRVANDSLPDAQSWHAFTDGVYMTKKFMADNAWIFGKWIVAAVNMHIRPANPCACHTYTHFALLRLYRLAFLNH
jgi:hypothetical protein